MASSPQAPPSSSQFESILDAALSEYKKKTGKDLVNDWVAKELQSCDSVEAVLGILQDQAEAFDKFKNGDKRLMKWIGSSVSVLYKISTTLGQSAGTAHPHAKVVFGGIAFLLAAAKEVRASHDVLVDLFERIQFFLKRLGVHTQISPTMGMVEILVKIMAEVISILSIATKEMQQSRTKTYLKKLLGRTDIEDALKRLDGLTQEEVRMAIAQVLKAINELKYDAKKANEAVQMIANDVGEIKWNQIEQDVRKWLSPPDPSINYNIARWAYQEGTAAWFFQGGIFKEWELVGSLLWIHGKPGSGKSILCSAIIEHFISLHDAGHATLAYFFFDFRDKEKKQDVRNFLTSLLIQLSVHLNPCREIISCIYSAHGKGTRQASIGVLMNCLHEMLNVAARQPTYIFVDALDECPNISGLPTPREELLDLLVDLIGWHIPNLHICITSRPEVDIKVVLEPLAYGAVSIHDESGQKKDISDYLTTVVNSNKMRRRWRDEDKKLVVEVLSEKADGMFRWVYCQLEVLQNCFPSTIRQTLDRLPESLDETYARVLGQIPQVNRENAHRMLQCLMVAVRPLHVEELAEVLAFEFGTCQGAVPNYRADLRPNDQVEAVLSICSSLIAIVDDHDSHIVQFSHFSVKEFLMSDRLRLTSSLGDFSQYHIFPGPAHTIFARACLGVLVRLDDRVDKESAKDFPLAKYAAEHWVTHAQFGDVTSQVKEGMVSLFDSDKPHFSAWVATYNIDTRPVSEWMFGISTPLYYASICGFSDLVECLAIKHPENVNAVGGNYGLPLLAALVWEHVQAAEILLRHGATVDIWEMEDWEPFYNAFRKDGIAHFLVKHGANAHFQNDNLRTPLHKAISFRHIELVRELLQHGVGVDCRDIEGMAPLHLLSEDTAGDYDQDDSSDLARLLLECGADVNIRDEDGNTPLHPIMNSCMYGTARVLLKHGADIRAMNNLGVTPVHLLIENLGQKSHVEGDGEFCNEILDMVQLSIEHIVEEEIWMTNKWALLDMSVVMGRPEIVRVLLDHGADTIAKNQKGETLLHLVSEGGYDSQGCVSTARLLLERGVDVHAIDEDENTALHCAAFAASPGITRVLLDHGANTNAKNVNGETPLHHVSRGRGSEEGVSTTRLLLERGVDVHAIDEDENTALHCAARSADLGITRMLLDHGANMNVKNKNGETLLHQVSQCWPHTGSGTSITRLLLERGVDVHAIDEDENTALHRATSNNNSWITRVLLDHGANTNAKNKNGETALHRVSHDGFSSEDGVFTTQLLLEHGADVHAIDKDENTALHRAAFKGKFGMAQVFLDHGADTNTRNKQGETPLHVVSRGEKDCTATARLLLEHGVDVHAQDKDRNTALHLAAFRGKLEITRMLLDHGANTNAKNENGDTPLHRVSRGKCNSQEDSVSITRLLLERGVDVHAIDKGENTALHCAAFRARLGITRVLLDHGANTNAKNKNGETPLHWVSRGKYSSQEDGVSIARLLLEHGVDVHAIDKGKNTALHWAASKARLEITRVFLDHGADTNTKNQKGETLLHIVSQGEYDTQEHIVGITRLLLERGMDVNAKEKDEWTPLHWAAFKGKLEMAQVFLDHGADTNARNTEGETPLHVLSRSEKDCTATAQLLLEHGVDVHAQDKDRDTALHSAAFRGKLEIARVLVDHGAHVNADNEQGKTPLHLVSGGKYETQEHGVGITRLLLERGVDVNALDKDKNTPLDYASYFGRLEIAQVLLDHSAKAVGPATESTQGTKRKADDTGSRSEKKPRT